jgi:hypothetical protein
MSFKTPLMYTSDVELEQTATVKRLHEICSSYYWIERKVFAFSKRWRKNNLPRGFYKSGIEKRVTLWETVIASNGNYIID